MNFSAVALPRAGWRGAGLAICAGLLAGMGQAPFDFWQLGILGFAGGIWLVAEADRPARMAWLFGISYFALCLNWIVEPFLVDAARHGWMAPFALLAMSGGLALFWLAAGWIADHSRWPAAAFAAGLVVVEGARAYVFSGFPWAHPGHILIDTPALALAGFAGPHGLTILVLAVTALLALLVQAGRRIATIGAFLAITGGLALSPTPEPRPLPENAAQIRLIQPNAAQDLKWRADMIPIFFERALSLTQGGPIDLIVWPETALPVLLQDSAAARQAIAEAAGGAPVVVGVQRLQDGQPRNALALLSPSGDVVATYDKHRLVPFGEYVPLRGLAARAQIGGLAAVLGGGYWPGSGPQSLDLGPELGRAFLMICYEAIFPQYLRQIERPDWQLHLTNDAWFGTFSGPYQHLALARLRAAESGLPVLRAANTGISAVIDGHGHILASLPLGSEGALDAVLPPALPPTYYTRWGDAPPLVLAALLMAGLLAPARKIPR
ncbi:MAG: apolipoprotein N-acyltransferase [Pseudomonadota bacterium]